MNNTVFSRKYEKTSTKNWFIKLEMILKTKIIHTEVLIYIYIYNMENDLLIIHIKNMVNDLLMIHVKSVYLFT